MQSFQPEQLPNLSPYGYSIKRELGHNYSGGRVTYLATENATEQPVVIKQFQFACRGASWWGYSAMQREIFVLQQLDHLGIPRYLNSFETNDGFCLVQEYKNAQSLAVQCSFTLEQIKEIAIKVLEILIYLQSFTPLVIHRDLKPENILADDKLNVYIVDFGLARIGGEDLAMSSVVVGTTGFMPPEQLHNQKLTTASDLYGLGATLICLLSGIKSNTLSKYIDENYWINIDRILHTSANSKFKQWLKKLIAPRLCERFINAVTAREALLELNNTYTTRRQKLRYPERKGQIFLSRRGNQILCLCLSFAILYVITVISFGSPTLNSIYQQVLKRDAIRIEKIQYGFGLAIGMTSNEVRNQIAHSEEAESKINNIYIQVLERDVDYSSEMLSHRSDLAKGMTLDEMRNQIAHSEETEKKINDIYKQVLEPSIVYVDAIAKGQINLAKGITFNELRREIVYSNREKIKTKINNIYQCLFTKDVEAERFQIYLNFLEGGETTLEWIREEAKHNPFACLSLTNTCCLSSDF